MAPLRTLAGLLISVAACGGHYGRSTTPTGPDADGKMSIEAAALPYSIVDRGGHTTDMAAFWSRLASARAVCVGEDHPNPHHHWVQLMVVRELAKRVHKGDKLALGLEMIQRPFQGVVDDYEAKRIDAPTLRSRAGWEERWGYDWGYYGPTIDAAIGAGAHVLALNAPKELTKKVVRHGLESLSPDEAAQLPRLELHDATHRAWFDATMESMGGGAAHGHQPSEDSKPQDGVTETKLEEKKDDKMDKKEEPPPAPPPNIPAHAAAGVEMPSADRVYTVQVIWDETMADGAAKWLAANPRGHLILLAGNGHCHDSAIVGRMKRRGIADAVSVRAVIDDGEGSVAEVLAKPINDFVLVLQLPKAPKTASAH